MRFHFWPIAGSVLAGLVSLGVPAHLCSQPSDANPTVASMALPDAPQLDSASLQSASQAQPSAQGQTQTDSSAAAQKPAGSTTPAHELPPEPKRILGVMPNYRAVSAGVIPPPPTSREAFMMATQNSFDYSAFVFVGITSLLAEGDDAHPELGKGVKGFWAYSWRGFLDKTDGNYWVFWGLPTVLREDERYYAMGQGGIWKRGVYAGTRVLITPNYHGKNCFNISEILGRGASEAISLAYYPSQDQNASSYAEKYAYAVGRDALTNVFREFWPDIDSHVLHRHRH